MEQEIDIHARDMQWYYLDRSLILFGAQVDGGESWPTYWNDC